MKTILYFGTLTVLLSLNIKAQSFGNALQFDGVNDYVNMGNDFTLDVGTEVTYEAWINPDTSLNGFIFNKWVAFAEDKQFLFTGNGIGFYLHNVFGGTSLYSSPSILLHQYTHVAATYNGSTAKLYINGVFDTSRSVGSGVGNSNGNLYVGHNAARGDFIAPFKGIIDEIRIWNVARTETEIQSTMNQTLNGNEAGLVGYWKFDEGTGTITYDATSNHNDGTISGATWVNSGVLDVESIIGEVPERFSLEQNYPNPFNPTTKIKFTIPSRAEYYSVPQIVTLKVYDVLGNEVATLVDEYKPAGSYEVVFDSHSDDGQNLPADRQSLSSGIYFYRIQTGSFTETKKMILMR